MTKDSTTNPQPSSIEIDEKSYNYNSKEDALNALSNLGMLDYDPAWERYITPKEKETFLAEVTKLEDDNKVKLIAAYLQHYNAHIQPDIKMLKNLISLTTASEMNEFLEKNKLLQIAEQEFENYLKPNKKIFLNELKSWDADKINSVLFPLLRIARKMKDNLKPDIKMLKNLIPLHSYKQRTDFLTFNVELQFEKAQLSNCLKNISKSKEDDKGEKKNFQETIKKLIVEIDKFIEQPYSTSFKNATKLYNDFQTLSKKLDPKFKKDVFNGYTAFNNELFNPEHDKTFTKNLKHFAEVFDGKDKPKVLNEAGGMEQNKINAIANSLRNFEAKDKLKVFNQVKDLPLLKINAIANCLMNFEAKDKLTVFDQVKDLDLKKINALTYFYSYSFKKFEEKTKLQVLNELKDKPLKDIYNSIETPKQPSFVKLESKEVFSDELKNNVKHPSPLPPNVTKQVELFSKEDSNAVYAEQVKLKSSDKKNFEALANYLEEKKERLKSLSPNTTMLKNLISRNSEVEMDGLVDFYSELKLVKADLEKSKANKPKADILKSRLDAIINDPFDQNKFNEVKELAKEYKNEHRKTFGQLLGGKSHFYSGIDRFLKSSENFLKNQALANLDKQLDFLKSGDKEAVFDKVKAFDVEKINAITKFTGQLSSFEERYRKDVFDEVKAFDVDKIYTLAKLTEQILSCKQEDRKGVFDKVKGFDAEKINILANCFQTTGTEEIKDLTRMILTFETKELDSFIETHRNINLLKEYSKSKPNQTKSNQPNPTQKNKSKGNSR
jgi:hypothetical protein